ncbi:hypothetical protein [Selenomonas ruminantium]|uniref:Uncharacterized protein n=1 Tax=Selenomonas ruminantium TaxID=971 RepID=A0A1H0P4X0_SELRU|nr:hypothetical protein [Selenomonas ruminantium]SDP00072.1 hypothetical protein SAMN05216366_104114 [Selenomonas ruminantium]
MNETEKELRKLLDNMTEIQWRVLRRAKRGDAQIMALLMLVGRQRGWVHDGV